MFELRNKEDYGDIDEETLRLFTLVNKTRDVSAFEYEGILYLGDRVTSVKQFIKNNPQPADMSVWFQDNLKILK